MWSIQSEREQLKTDYIYRDFKLMKISSECAGGKSKVDIAGKCINECTVVYEGEHTVIKLINCWIQLM